MGYHHCSADITLVDVTLFDVTLVDITLIDVTLRIGSDLLVHTSCLPDRGRAGLCGGWLWARPPSQSERMPPPVVLVHTSVHTPIQHRPLSRLVCMRSRPLRLV